jgi:hypothetical protein
MAGVPRSMVSLASQRSRTTTSASTASGQRSLRPPAQVYVGGCGPGQASRAGRLGAARPDMASDGSGSSVTTRMVGLRAAIRLPPSCAIWLRLVVTGPPDMGQTPPAGRGIRPYGTGPDWKRLRSVRRKHSPGEARFDAKSEHLGRQEARRINSQDCQTAAHARAATSSEDGRRGARPSGLSTGLAGGGARPMALDPHPRRRSGHDRLA